MKGPDLRSLKRPVAYLIVVKKNTKYISRSKRTLSDVENYSDVPPML